MNVEENDFRRRYAELSDEGLLSVNREELIDIARESYDQELSRRGLQYEQDISVEPAGVADELVSATTFLFPDEAEVARGLLRSCDIVCYLENEHILAKVWPWSYALGGLRLMVPASLLEQVHEILNEPFREEDLPLTGMEPQVGSGEEGVSLIRGRNGGRARTMLAIGIFFSPAVDLLRVFYGRTLTKARMPYRCCRIRETLACAASAKATPRPPAIVSAASLR